MATTLKAIIAFTIGAGASAALPHTLNINGVGKVPDTIEVDNSAFSIAGSDATNVNVQNNSAAAGSVNVLVEYWYSPERIFGASSTTALSPRPFVPTASRLDSSSYIYPAGTEEIRYVRSATGDDANDGLSPATAWLTLNKGLGFLSGFSTNRNLILDVSDSTFSDSEQLNFPALFGGVNNDLDFGGIGVNNFFFKTIGQIRASQTLQQALTITLVTPDPVTGMPVFTVSEGLTPGAHVGQFILGSGLSEYGVIVANDASTLTVASTITALTGPVGVYIPSTTFTFGAGDDNFFQESIYIDMFANYTIQGISFLANGTFQSALAVNSVMPWHLFLCQIQGLYVSGPGQGVMDACYVTRLFGLNAASMERRSSFFDGCNMLNHGDGASGMNNVNGCYFDSCQPVFSGNVESRVGGSITNTEIANGSAEGVIMRGGNIGRIKDCRIRDCAADGILADVPMRLLVDNVVGTGNVGHGALLQNGAQAGVLNGPTLTGTVGEVSLGGTGTVAWAAAPATDVAALAPQFCRIF